MKKVLLLLFPLMLVAFITGCREKRVAADPDIYGVWANADCELVQTGKYSLFFERSGEMISVILRQNKKEGDVVYTDFVAGYLFDNANGKYEPVLCPSDKIRIRMDEFARISDGKILVAGSFSTVVLEHVEKIDIAEPYEMPRADPGNIGECLQAWQLGTLVYNMSPENMHFEIGTNRGSYIFSSNPSSVYCRSARIRHNNNGTLFAQNIRLMANSNEFTAHMERDNLAVLRSVPEIDDSLFDTDACVFADEGIYWSFISCTQDEIRLNGCGEVYTFKRPQKSAKHVAEWFACATY